MDRDLSPVLRGIAEGRPASAEERRILAETVCCGPVQPAFSTSDSPDEVVAGRIKLLHDLWGPFSEWWRGYFADCTATEVPVVGLWELYLPFGQWIVHQKRKHRPDELFMVGFNGSPGAGKTVLTNALTVVLNHLLDRDTEGQAIARSGDDWYLRKSDREPLKEQGYDPGVPGVSNRSLPGTHDFGWLLRNLSELEHSTPDSVIRMGNFDKKNDDQPDQPYEVHGKVGVFLFDLWFAGAETTVDPTGLPDGLRRRVVEHLHRWQAVFDRMDALWAYDWPSFDQMVQEREAQEVLVAQRRGERGMSSGQIRSFMAYMIERAWDWRTTSPVAPDKAVTFRARRDTEHRVIAVQRGGRAS